MEMLNLIEQEIKSWSKQILEKPLPLFANMPPCPFVRKAWLDKNVQVHVVKNLEQIIYIKIPGSIIHLNLIYTPFLYLKK